jgi:hypothetical protein
VRDFWQLRLRLWAHPRGALQRGEPIAGRAVNVGDAAGAADAAGAREQGGDGRGVA